MACFSSLMWKKVNQVNRENIGIVFCSISELNWLPNAELVWMLCSYILVAVNRENDGDACIFSAAFSL